METEINGIPCYISVTHYIRVPPDPKNDASDLDCLGYVEFEYDVLDENMNPAPGLQKQIDDVKDAEILAMYEEAMEDAA